jgi:SagB-type dehydrogenase family enzyme
MSNRDTEAALNYHQETKHSYESVASDPHFLDWSNQPIPFKTYLELDPLRLPSQWTETEVPALGAISGLTHSTESETIPTLDQLARLLYFSAGLTKTRPYPGGEIQFRAASCTGALYQVELYVVCGALPDLPAGLYHFNPQDFSLSRLRDGDYRANIARASGEEPNLLRAPATIICTGTYWRNAWKYRARAYRHFGWDNGTILANLLATGFTLQLPTHLILGFVDEEVNRLLDLNGDREVALSMVAVGQTREKMIGPLPEVEPLGLSTQALSRSEVDYPEMRVVHSASCLASGQEAAEWREATPDLDFPASKGPVRQLDPHAEATVDSLEAVVRRRGSSRQFERKPISFQQLSTMLSCSAQGIEADFLDPVGSSLNHWYLIVHAVEGLPPGAYVFHRQRGELELLKEGDFRSAAGHLGLGQELPADASVDIFFLADLAAILESFGNRGYRAVQMEAGILGGKLYLAAYAQRLGASGLTFYDDDVVEFFSPHAQGKSAIFLMALGHSQKRQSFS